MTGRAVQLLTLLVCLAVGALAAGLDTLPGEAAKNKRGKAKAEVFHGQAVPFGKYPFMASVGLSDGAGGFKKRFCGGSLIGPSSVLTAAHCVRGAAPEQLAVVVGATEIVASQGQQRAVVSVFVHPQFRAKTLKYDVAVLRLNQPVTGITPIALVTSGDSSYTFGGAPLTVAGWGNTTGFRGKRPKANYPKTLREMGIAVVANSRCNKRWHRVGIKNGIPGPTDICTTGNRFGPGDSGGPVFSNLAGPPVQVSLVSAGASSLVRVPRVPDLSTRLNEPSIAGFIASVNS